MNQKNILKLGLFITLVGLTGCSAIGGTKIQELQFGASDEVKTDTLGILPTDFFNALNEINPELKLEEEMFEEVTSGYHMAYIADGFIITYFTFEEDSLIETTNESKFGMMYQIGIQLTTSSEAVTTYVDDFIEAFNEAGMDKFVHADMISL